MRLKSHILPVVAGTMAGMMLWVIGEKIIHTSYPPPLGTRIETKQEMAAYISTLPAQAFASLLVNYVICSIIAGAVSTLVSRNNSKAPAIVTGCLLAMAGIFNAVTVPLQPTWFTALNILLFLPSAYTGYLLAVRLPRMRRGL